LRAAKSRTSRKKALQFVAQEVRNLAAKSATAAKGNNALIERLHQEGTTTALK
jgi:methyl-accepting chemotaxis protein